MSQSPLEATGSKDYADAWRAINILIRSDGSWSGRERNLCFRNLGDGTFDDVSFLSGLDIDADGRAFVPIDLDLDGDQDLVLKNRNGRQLRAFRNDMPQGRSRQLAIRTRGVRSNRDGVGSRIWLTTDRRTMMREIASGSGYLSQRSRQATFSLPDGETVQSVRVRWPLGSVQHFQDPPAQGTILLLEGEAGISDLSGRTTSPEESEPAGMAAGASTPGTSLAVPLPAPGFELPVVNGHEGTVRLSDRRGQFVLLNFWATWCPPCRSELAAFQRELEALRRNGVDVLAVSVDGPDSLTAVAALAESLALEYDVLIADSQTAETYSVLNERIFDRRRELAIPTSFLLDRQRRIVKVYRGPVEVDAIVDDARSESLEALPFAGHWAVSRPRRDFEELASAFAERGLADPARTMFAEAAARGERSPRLLNNLAGALIAAGDAARAEALLREALAAEPRMTDARVNLATLLVQQGDPFEAARLLEAALALQPRDGQVLSVLGSLRFSQGDLDVAQTLFRRAVDARPEDHRFRENLGAVLASQGRFEAALAEYESARDLGASGADLQTNLGVLYIQTGRATEALDAFVKASEADPESAGPHLNLARLRLQLGDVDRAIQSIGRARRADPDDLQALLLESRALATLGRTGGAIESAREALRRHPNSSEAAELLESLR